MSDKRNEIIIQAQQTLALCFGHFNFNGIKTRAVFEVDYEGRAVKCTLVDVETKNPIRHAYSLCAEGDCFNKYIGAVIALYRAWGIKVPTDFLNAPLPEKAYMGNYGVLNECDHELHITDCYLLDTFNNRIKYGTARVTVDN